MAALAIALASCAAADVTCWLVVPADQRAGSIYAQAPAALQREQVRVVTDSKPAEAPNVVVVYPRAIGTVASLDEIIAASDQGAGIVLIYSSDISSVPDRLLQRWRARIVAAEADTARVELADHPVTSGIRDIFIWRVPATIRGLRPLIRQGDNVVAAQGTRDGRRIVVLPLDAVVPGQAGDVIPPPNMRLLVQAVLWAGGASASAKSPAEKPAGPSGRQAQPVLGKPGLSRGSFRAIAYLDMSADNEDWPDIREAVARLLQDAGLRTEDVRLPRRPKDDKKKKDDKQAPPAPEDVRRLPLIRALRDDPALLVLGSCRPLAEAEQVAVAAYVEAGGALLALPRATHKTNRRLVWLNELLVDFGLSATLARPKGKAEILPPDLAQQVGEIGEIPDGIRVVGGRTTPWVVVHDVPVVIAETFGMGRVGVADPLPLLKAKEESVRRAWAKLLHALVRYLTAGMELR